MTKPILVLGDSCIGTEPRHLQNLERVIDLACKRMEAADIKTGLFLGDQVMGYCEEDQLREQWRQFKAGPVARLASGLGWFRQIASNHVCFDDTSAGIYEEVQGPAEWSETYDGIQYLAINTAFPSRHGDAGIDTHALENRLSALDPALPIVVLGHHPVWPINGYDRAPLWVVERSEAEEAWRLFRRFGVELYLCSHIIAFDVQLHDGILQLCTGGAGTEYGPNGAMPGLIEGPHFVLVDGVGSDHLHIEHVPVSALPSENWYMEKSKTGWRPACRPDCEATSAAAGYRISLQRQEHLPAEVLAYAETEGPPVLGVTISDLAVEVSLVPLPGEDPRLWQSSLPAGWNTIQIDLLRGAGPGGVLLTIDGGTCSSMQSTASRGLESCRSVTKSGSLQWEVTMLR